MNDHSPIRNVARQFCVAISFLTVVPVPKRYGEKADALGESASMYPAVGVVLGLILGGLSVLAGFAFGPWVSAVLVTLLMVGVSGGFHMDGLSDTADGFLSSRPRERILEIMKDSHIGVMGVLAILFVLLLKMAALQTMLPEYRFGAVFLAVLVGRCSMLAGMVLLPPANPQGGLGQMFLSGRTTCELAMALVIPAAFALLFLGLAGLLAVMVAGLLLWGVGAWAKRKIGGATGDIFGAMCELAEVAVLLSLSSRPGIWLAELWGGLLG